MSNIYLDKGEHITGNTRERNRTYEVPALVASLKQVRQIY